MPKGNPDGYVDTGASIEDAAIDLTPEEFAELMEELNIKLKGPADPRPTAGEMRDYANTSGYWSDPMWGTAHSLTRSTQPEARGFAGNPPPVPGSMRGAADEAPVTREAYETMQKNLPNLFEAFIQSGPIGAARRPYSTFAQFLDEYQKRIDPDYPEKQDAERKARMDELKARVRERMARFKL